MMKIKLRNGIVQYEPYFVEALRGEAGMAELADAMDSKPIVARHESSILSPGTSVFVLERDEFTYLLSCFYHCFVVVL